MKKLALLNNFIGSKKNYKAIVKYSFILKKALFLTLIVCAIQLKAQKTIDLMPREQITEVKSNSFSSTKVNYVFSNLNALEIVTEKGGFTELILSRGYSIGKLGAPKLPASKDLIEVPFGADVNVKVLSYTVEEYILNDLGIEKPLMPVQPSLRKDQDVSEVPFEYNELLYSKSEFVEHEVASVEVLGVLRGVRMARLTVAPVSYNPQTGIVKIKNNIELEIQYSGADIELTNYIKASTYSPYFDVVYNKTINSFSTRDIFNDYPDLTKNPIKMLIVSHPDFEETLQPFIEWKTQQGFLLKVAYTDEIGGTASAVQSWIHEQYNAGTPQDPAPTFVVIVGDPGKIPASAIGSSSGVVTDLYYASVDGDYFPEMYLGRLSARNTTELQNQIDKIIYYQKYEFTDPAYLNDVTLIAGSDSYWNPRIGQPTIHYGTQNYFNAAHGFENINTYLSSYAGCYDNERISVSMINYTAHCSSTSWGSPLLTVSNVHNMTNEGKYPLAIGNCCQSALFSVGESIGEAWVRAENKGAVAYVGSAPNSYWFEDFYWAVGAFPLTGNNDGYVPTAEETTLGAYDAPFVSDYAAVASIKFVGNLAVTEVDLEGYPSHSSPLYYWQAYQTLGDPSTVIYYTEGAENEVSHMSLVPIGVDIYTVEALPGSYVGISMNGHLHGAALVGESGEVDVPIEPVLDGGDVLIVVTMPQHIPYITTVPASALEGPFVVIDEYNINGYDGSQQANYGESFSIDLTLKNVGTDSVGQVTATLYGEDTFITLLDGDTPVDFPEMAAGQTGNTSTVKDAFNFEVAIDVPDLHQATYVLSVTDGNEEWTSNLRITANAPVFIINPDFIVNDSNGGDGNNHLDPGESAKLVFEIKNNGHAIARQPVISMDGSSPYLVIQQNQLDLLPIAPGETVEASFEVDAHDSTPQGTIISFVLNIEDGHWAEAITQLVIGQTSEIFIGEGTETATQYPFYNYFKANRSQMLYAVSDIGAGEKTIAEIGFNITRVATQYNNLPNFYIRMMHTSHENLDGMSSFINTDNAEVVFHAETYQMPTQTGWKTWELQSAFEYDGSSNVLVEIVWGQLPNWTSTSYQLASTTMTDNMVAYGYSDNDAIPSFNSLSKTRPNMWLEIATEEVGEAKNVSFFIIDTFSNILEGAGVKIGSLTKYSDKDGLAIFNLMPGNYAYHASKEGYSDFSGFFDIMETDIYVTVILAGGENNIIEELSDEFKILVFPNPTQGSVNIELSGISGPIDLTIMNYQGQYVSSKNINSDGFTEKATFNLRNLAKGIYYLKIQSGDMVRINKIVLQ